MRLRAQTVLLFTCLLPIWVLSRGDVPSSQAGGMPAPLIPERPPVAPFQPGDGPVQTAEGLWMMPDGSQSMKAPAELAPQDSGGPDDYGYTWSDSVPYSWIDASGGSQTGINNTVDHAGPINLGFSFKYYENTYGQLYISRFGFLAFNDVSLYRSQSSIPSPSLPNDIIAPHWVPGYSPSGYVRYLYGGTAPNRWFAVEWNRLVSDCCQGDPAEEYTFEAILHENGDIVFQYAAMTVTGGYICQSSGIEDSAGLDGLSITDFCRQIAPYHAVRVFRPPPSARVSIRPLFQGRHTHAGERVAFQVPVHNMGEFGTDTYDLFPASPWSVALFAADGTTPLADTDGDGAVDTGPVAQGNTANITVEVQTPGGAAVGAGSTADIMARSSINTGKTRTVHLQTAVPAAFAQAYTDWADWAMSLYLAQPGAQALKTAAPGPQAGDGAIAETSNGFAYFWRTSRCLGNCSVYVNELKYALLDKYGDVARAVTRLTDHSAAAINTYDGSPAVTVAPNGRIGVAWSRYLWNASTAQYNYNVFFAILDAVGNRIYGPVSLTNNPIWGDGDDYGVPSYYSLRMAATTDNRFLLAWNTQSLQPPTGGCTQWCWLNDVYYAVLDSGGNTVRGITKYTNGVPGSAYYGNPALTALDGNRVLLAYMAPAGLSYAVLDSQGNTVKPEAVAGGYGWGVDATRLANGRPIIAWLGSTGSRYQVTFAILDSVTYHVISGPTVLGNPAAVTGDANISVTGTASGSAILTWTDSDGNYRRNLYYALIGNGGAILTSPMIFHTSQAAIPGVQVSYEGYGNTTYSWTPPAAVDGVADFTASLFGGPPGGSAAAGVNLSNHGVTLAARVIVTATLPVSLTYTSDTSGITPTISGSDVVWSFPDLPFLEDRDFILRLGVPAGAAYGSRYPLTISLASDGPEANLADNLDAAEVMAAYQVYLPVTKRE